MVGQHWLWLCGNKPLPEPVLTNFSDSIWHVKGHKERVLWNIGSSTAENISKSQFSTLLFTRMAKMSWRKCSDKTNAIQLSLHHQHQAHLRPPLSLTLNGAIFDFAPISARLVHNMSRSQLYLEFGHFVCPLLLFLSVAFGVLLLKDTSADFFYLSPGWCVDLVCCSLLRFLVHIYILWPHVYINLYNMYFISCMYHFISHHIMYLSYFSLCVFIEPMHRNKPNITNSYIFVQGWILRHSTRKLK